MPGFLAQSQERLLIINDSFPLEIDLETGRFGTGRLYFDDPMDLSANKDGDLFILDAGNYRIQVMDEDGDFLRKWNLRESSKEGFDEPVAMAMSYDEDFLVVLDGDEGEVKRYDLKGEFLNSFGESGTRKGTLDKPVDLTVDSLGYVYVLDRARCKVLKFHRKGAFVEEWGKRGRGDKDFDDPISITFSDELTGIIYVLDMGKKALLKFQRDGDFREIIPIPPRILENGTNLLKLEASKDNNLFILDAGLGRLVRMEPRSFNVYLLASDSMQMSQPRGLAVDENNNIYISDIKRNRVYRLPMEVN
ncbi:MAG: NHL repeat-containing protein [bacterium]|nr:NHL repeat-containing protein [bacterium]MDT8365932.1 NHL repeat-containing protein [bacterium]